MSRKTSKNDRVRRNCTYTVVYDREASIWVENEKNDWRSARLLKTHVVFLESVHNDDYADPAHRDARVREVMSYLDFPESRLSLIKPRRSYTVLSDAAGIPRLVKVGKVSSTVI